MVHCGRAPVVRAWRAARFGATSGALGARITGAGGGVFEVWKASFSASREVSTSSSTSNSSSPPVPSYSDSGAGCKPHAISLSIESVPHRPFPYEESASESLSIPRRGTVDPHGDARNAQQQSRRSRRSIPGVKRITLLLCRRATFLSGRVALRRLSSPRSVHPHPTRPQRPATRGPTRAPFAPHAGELPTMVHSADDTTGAPLFGRIACFHSARLQRMASIG